MDFNINFNEIQVHRLSHIHDTSNFDCGDNDINDFLKEDALKWQDKRLAVTRIFVYNEEIIGFFCSSADSLKLKTKERKEESKLHEKRIREIPAIKIGRLGRSIKYKNYCLGIFILEWAIGYVLEISKQTGVRFVTVDAYPRKTEWYEKIGFKRNLHKDYNERKDVSMRYCLYNPPKK